jgi:hypothetical protein
MVDLHPAQHHLAAGIEGMDIEARAGKGGPAGAAETFQCRKVGEGRQLVRRLVTVDEVARTAVRDNGAAFVGKQRVGLEGGFENFGSGKLRRLDTKQAGTVDGVSFVHNRILYLERRHDAVGFFT